MKKERKNLILLVGTLIFLLGTTMSIALKTDKIPAIQRSNTHSSYFKTVADLEGSMEQAQKLIQQKEFNQAVDLLNRIIASYPEASVPRMRLGSVYYQQKNYAKAEQTFSDLLKYHPNNAAAYNNLCETLIRQNRLPEAKSAITKAIELAPENYEIQLNAASLYALLHEDQKAVELLHRALNNGATPEMVIKYRELVKLQERQ